MFRYFATAAMSVAFIGWGMSSDHESRPADWRMNVGLTAGDHKKGVEEFSEDGLRMVDYEVYRMNRVNVHSSVWVEKESGAEWKFEKELPYREFEDKREEYANKGFQLVEVEMGRIGAGLLFSGVWLKKEKGETTIFFMGMDELMFSNRYGEMADREYRLVDFETYEANGKLRYAGIWIRNNGMNPRFYRGLSKKDFLTVAAKLEGEGYRIIDVESYETEDGQRFAAQWVKRLENQESRFAFDLLPDDYYQKNTAYTEAGYRLIDFEVFALGNQARYSGSWVRDQLNDEEKQEKKKESFLEVLRKGDQ
ncbi:MAG: hypothetical protein AAGB46_17945 [Verrucomicrobiota bacterium]